MPDDWFESQMPRFSPDWMTAKNIRYRSPRHWHWLRIYALVFYVVAVPAVLFLTPWH